MIDRSYIAWLWALALLGTALDQGTKYSVFKWLSTAPEGKQIVIPDMFELLSQYTDKKEESKIGILGRLRTLSADRLPQVNQGALFGWGKDYGPLANAIFAGISICAAAAIVVWSRRRSTKRDAVLCAALGLILAGTLGNLYDRLIFSGVRDFFHFHYQTFDWPVFNVADCWLVCGAAILLMQALWVRPHSHEADGKVMEPTADMVEVK
jgi:lipoprotein signal peptidase